ncbi:hypothetical protein ACP4OV_011855 [Aristida adscensionis]
MEQGGGGGEVAVARAAPEADDGADRISALPDDALVLILLRLKTAAAARTSVLSRRWRRLWRLLPELSFRRPVAVDRLLAVLEGHEAPLQALLIRLRLAATADSKAALLRAAARRVCGRLDFVDTAPPRDEGAQENAFALPCFDRATSISLDLGFRGLAAPAAGVFARLAELNLRCVQFEGPWGIGDSFSSPRFPCLQKLSIHDAWTMESLTIHSDCLLQVELNNTYGLRQLTIVAPALEQLRVMPCSRPRQPDVNISAPQLKLLWMDMFDPRLVHLGNMEHEHAQRLGSFDLLVYGNEEAHSQHNHAAQRLWRHFKVVEDLTLGLFYPDVISGNLQYLMDDMTILPDITFLHLNVMANRHVFGASSFHVLKMCSGIRRLCLALVNTRDGDYTCPSGCICRQQSNWESEELFLNHLQELVLIGIRGSEHEAPFVRRLFNWATVLSKLSVFFDVSVTESMAKELYQIVQSFSRPEICMEFYRDLNGNKVLYAPKD